MGYRFSIETANTVANLAFGKVLSCYRDIFSSKDRYWEFKEFIDAFEKNIYFGDNLNRNYLNDDGHYGRRRKEFNEIIYRLSLQFEEHRHSGFNSIVDNNNEFQHFYHKNIEFIELLGDLSELIKQCRVKSLLLPAPHFQNENNISDVMTHADILERLLHLHPYDSCLILQPKERPNSKNIAIFDSFPNFDVALRQLDLWPAVMFWNNRNDFIFAPIQHIDQLEEMYAIIHYERRNSFGELRKFISDRTKPTKSHYYLHLSDLHFGAKSVPVNVRRLKTLIQKQVGSFTKNNYKNTVNFVITGDVVDSPNPINTITYYDFFDFLDSQSNNSTSPLVVLGNHDINNHGLAIGKNNQQLISSIGTYPRIQIDNELKVVFLLFNSNSKGFLAEGEIGTQQLSEMGNILDKNGDIADYKKVAVLHHHLIEIPKPEWRTERWYKKIIPSNFLESTLRLRDANTFREWLKKREVKLVLHGHKHVPFIGEDDGIYIVACGSSTGQIENIDPQKTYISYNVLKFNEDTVTCTLYAEDLLGSGATDIQTSTFKY